jgi:hypothetical protein
MPPAIPLGTHLFLVAAPLLVIVAVLIVFFAGGRHER